MRQPSITVASCEETSAGFDPESISVQSFDTPAEAKAFIENETDTGAKELNAEPKYTAGSIRDLFDRRDGLLTVSVGEHLLHFRFHREDGEYGVSPEEMASVLEHFCNASPSPVKFRSVAEGVISKHRAVQAELWKFVKTLVRAFASAPCDTRNESAVRQAGDITRKFPGLFS